MITRGCCKIWETPTGWHYEIESRDGCVTFSGIFTPLNGVSPTKAASTVFAEYSKLMKEASVLFAE